MKSQDNWTLGQNEILYESANLHLKKNKQTNTKTDLHPAIWILPQFQHHLPKMTANISR